MRKFQHVAPATRRAQSRGFVCSARLLSLAVAILLAIPATADYNENIDGVVTDILLYEYDDKIYFRLQNQPTTHPACNPAYFAIDAATPADRRKMMLSRLLLAKATKEPMNVGYDKAGNCSHSYIRVHRVG
jgi:hypothetical protein